VKYHKTMLGLLCAQQRDLLFDFLCDVHHLDDCWMAGSRETP
jgi:hypothetical protein